MRKSLIILCGLLLVWSLTIIGCDGDDDCPAGPTTTDTLTVTDTVTITDTIQRAIMFGEALIDDGQLEFYGHIMGIDGLIPDVDSVKVDGQLADIVPQYSGPGVLRVVFEGPAGTLTSGDDVIIGIYMPNGSGFCSIILLEDDLDDPAAIDWEMHWPFDTVDIGSNIEIIWNNIPNADWYLIYFDYAYTDGVDHLFQENEPHFTTDTTFTIPSSSTSYNGYYIIDINAFTGPGPNATEGNIEGAVIKGAINSSTYDNFLIFVGDGDANPIAPELPKTLTHDKLRILDLMKKLLYEKLTH